MNMKELLLLPLETSYTPLVEERKGKPEFSLWHMTAVVQRNNSMGCPGHNEWGQVQFIEFGHPLSFQLAK